MMKKKYGFFSYAASRKHGTCVWRRPNGEEAHVTAVYSDEGAFQYRWPDKVRLGEVVEWVRDGLYGEQGLS